MRAAQRDADYAYRLAVDPPASKELRLFGLAGWTIDRFVARRTRLHELQYAATRLRERPVIWSMLLVLGANVVVFWLLAAAAVDGRISTRRSRGLRAERRRRVDDRLRRLQLGARRRRGAGRGGAAPGAGHASAGALPSGIGSRRWHAGPRDPLPRRHLRLSRGRAGARRLRPHASPPVRRSPSSARTAPARPPSPSCCAGSTIPQSGAIEVDGVDLRDFDLASWRARVTAVFQDFIRFELPLRDNVAPARRAGRGDRSRARRPPARANLAALDTVLARGYTGGTDLSGGQWQRVALARALCAVKLGAGVVLLDEPTAQLDVRGEAEIFDRILAATRHCTTILISHRFSTVRHADRICVLEHGQVVELGTHDELMALGGRYRTMFDLQAQRFDAPEEEEGVTYEVLA